MSNRMKRMQLRIAIGGMILLLAGAAWVYRMSYMLR